MLKAFQKKIHLRIFCMKKTIIQASNAAVPHPTTVQTASILLSTISRSWYVFPSASVATSRQIRRRPLIPSPCRLPHDGGTELLALPLSSALFGSLLHPTLPTGIETPSQKKLKSTHLSKSSQQRSDLIHMHMLPPALSKW